MLTDPEQSKWEYEDEKDEEPSIAASSVRNILWSYGGGTTSAVVATKIFVELGRVNEVGWLSTVGSL